MEERDPHGRDLKEPGAKSDLGKPPVMQGVLQYFPRALKAVALLSEAGAKKYSWQGWASVPDGPNRYGNAAVRHILDEATEGPIDQQTGVLHATATAWNSLARLELMLRDGTPSDRGE